MFITKMSLPRRSFLQGMGAAENGVKKFRVTLSCFGTVTEANQIQAQPVDYLFSLGEKVLFRFALIIIAISHRSLFKTRLKAEGMMRMEPAFILYISVSVPGASPG